MPYLEASQQASVIRIAVWGLLLILSVAGGVWWYGQVLGHREQQAAQALATVVGATRLRRNLIESLSYALEQMVLALRPTCAGLYLVESERLRLIHSVGIERFEHLAQLPVTDELATLALASPEGYVVEPLDGSLPWSALAAHRTSTLSLMRIGTRAEPLGLMALVWPSGWQTEANVPALININQYLHQMWNEYAELEARAQDVQALSGALQRQESLTRTAAHDLANKLATAYGLVTVLNTPEELPPASQTLLREAQRHLDLMATMLGDLRDPERPLEIDDVVIEELVELAAAMMLAPQAEGWVRFALEVEPHLPNLRGERLALVRVLDNLLMNAIRHNADRPTLNVWLRVRRCEADVQFEVGDDGGGIPAEAQTQLFEFGVRADSTGQVKGHGMGLWSCRRIVHAHAGRIWVESTLDAGARFMFTLPIAGPEVMANAV